jgi:hypothetical protein
MSAAGLSDVYRYGVRFVGYLIAVTLVGGVFLAGGALVGGQVLTDVAGGAAAGSGRAVGAIALIAIGALLLLSGVAGLAYKLVADAAMAGVAQGRAVDVSATDVETTADEGDNSARAATGAATDRADY